jgi:hypothetical protein
MVIINISSDMEEMPPLKVSSAILSLVFKFGFSLDTN